MKDIEDGIPIWTDRGNVGGLDPLAMLAPIEQLYQGLLSGVSSVTVRIRYYSFLAWWVHEYGQTIRSDSKSDLDAHIRKGEALIGLLSRAHQYVGGLAGENTFGMFLQNEAPDYDLVKLRETYLNVPAFFAVYGPQMAEVGILLRSNLHNLLVPTEELGIPLAQAFEEAIGQDAANLFRDVAQREIVDGETLRKMSPMDINFSDPAARTDEMDLLRGILVGRFGKGERRNSLIEILRVAQDSNALPEERVIRFRWLETLPSEAEPHFAERMKWAHFQVADSMRVGMEALLRHSVNILSDQGPMPPPDLAAEVCSTVPTGITFREYLFDLATDSDSFSMREIQERAASENDSLDLKMTLLAKLWVDWASKTAEMDITFPPRGHFRTSASEMRFLVSLEEKDAQSAMAEFIRYRILLRHLFVAARKLRFQGNNTFQLEYEDGNLIARQPGRVGPAGPRIGTIISFLKQLGLLDENGLTHLARAELQDQ